MTRRGHILVEYPLHEAEAVVALAAPLGHLDLKREDLLSACERTQRALDIERGAGGICADRSEAHMERAKAA